MCTFNVKKSVFIFIVCFVISGYAAGNPLTVHTNSYNILSGPQIKAVFGTGGTGEQAQVVHYQLSPESCRVVSTGDGFHDIRIRETTITGQPGAPAIPMKVIRIELPCQTKVTAVRLLSGRYCHIEDSVYISPMPPVQTCNTKLKNSVNNNIYESKDYYPGSWLSCDSGSDGRRTIVFIRIFPVQFIPGTKQGILLTQASIEVSYTSASRLLKMDAGFSETDAGNIILCPLAFMQAAEQLKNLHDSLSVTSSIYTVESIDSNYTPSGPIDLSGYEEEQPEELERYNFELAKKIKNFLAHREQHPNLVSVTILGTASHVPPSYYFKQANSDNIYEFFGPTDFLYASPDDDFVANYEVGRLPAASPEEALKIVAKIRRWCGQQNFNWFPNIALAGGQMFNQEYFMGELLLQDALNKDYVQGMTVDKYFETDGYFSKNHLLNVFANGNYGFLYIHCHGEGSRILFDEDTYISSEEILDCRNVVSQTPIVVSTSCMNAGFDSDIIPVPTGDDRTFGESLLLSNAGGIAYIGGTRLNWAGSVVGYDHGNIYIEKLKCVEAMIHYIFRAYNDGATRLGQLYKKPLEKFLEEHNINGPFDDRFEQILRVREVTMLWHTLLGDPVVQIPAQNPGTTSRAKPWLSAASYDYLNSDGIPVIRCNDDQTIAINVNSLSSAIFFKLLQYEKIQQDENYYTAEAVVLTNNIIDSQPPFQFFCNAQTGANNYILRATADDDKEGWFYFNANCTTGFDNTSGNAQLISAYTLFQNYPNPFNPSTTICFTLQKTEHTILKIYNITGREVAVLVNEVCSPGKHQAQWQTNGLSSGIYFARLEAGKFVKTIKLILNK